MVRVLSGLSDALAEKVAEVAPGIVRVEARRMRPASGILWSADGVIVTAHHTVHLDDDIRVGLPDGQTLQAELVGRDPSTDLAVLRTTSIDPSLPAWTELNSLRVGHLVLALGRPGKAIRATLGIVSALGDHWVTLAGGRVERYLQTDVVMYPGFSGGALVDVEGNILGLNTSALLRGISLTIPYTTVRRVVQTLLTHGRMRRGYLGVGTQPVRLPPGLAGQLDREVGLLVVNVARGSPAEQAGTLVGDIVIALGEQPVHSIDDLLAILSGAEGGAVVQMHIIRGGVGQDMKVTLGESP